MRGTKLIQSTCMIGVDWLCRQNRRLMAGYGWCVTSITGPNGDAQLYER